MRNRTALIAPAVVLLSACQSITLPGELKETVHKEREAYENTLASYQETPNIYHFDAFYVPPLEEGERSLPDWYFKQAAYQARSSTIGKISRFLQMKHGFSIEYRVGAKPERPVTGLLHAQTVGDVLDAIRSSTGYQYDIVDNTLVWKKYAEEVFPIRAIPGQYEYSIGKRNANQQGQNGGSGMGGSDSSFAQAGAVSNTGEEYSNVTGSINPIKEYLEGIEAVLGCSDSFDTTENNQSNASTNTAGTGSQAQENLLGLVSPGSQVINIQSNSERKWRCEEGAEVKAFDSDNSIYVRALPSQMDSVRTFVRNKTDRSMRSVRIDITLLTVTTKDSSALDLQVDIQDLVNGGELAWSTATNSAQSLVGGLTTPGSVSLNYENGTQGLIQALEENGDILQKTVIRGMALNNRIGNFTNVDKVSFIADRKLQTTSNVGATTGIEQQVAESGILLYMLPNIGKDDVMVHMSSSLSDLVTITKKGEVGNEVESPQISDRVFNTTLVLEPGRPILAAGSTVREIQAVSATSGVSGYSQSAQDRNTEILMIVEAVFL